MSLISLASLTAEKQSKRADSSRRDNDSDTRSVDVWSAEVA